MQSYKLRKEFSKKGDFFIFIFEKEKGEKIFEQRIRKGKGIFWTKESNRGLQIVIGQPL